MSGPAATWDFTAQTDLWTGRVVGINERKGRVELRESIKNSRLIPTGLLGSIRWWFEVVVRGLGGNACDPTRTKCQDGKHCVVCELFGCTGWARKFRFQVLDGNGEILGSAIKKDSKFKVRFVPLRPIASEERALLDLTLRLIAEYGAVGGKTVLKPSDEPNRADALHHLDYGVVSLDSSPGVAVGDERTLKGYLRQVSQRAAHDTSNATWASLANFWCVNGRYLTRAKADASTFNRVLGRQEPKQQAQTLASNGNADRWLAGSQQESKKVFSFKNPPRTFGFVLPGTISLDEMKTRLQPAWSDLRDGEFLTGADVLSKLVPAASEPAR